MNFVQNNMIIGFIHFGLLQNPDLIEQKSFVQFSSSSTGKKFSEASTVVNSTLNDIYSVRVTNVFPEATYTFRVVTANQYGHVTSSDASCHVKKIFNEGKKLLIFNTYFSY